MKEDSNAPMNDPEIESRIVAFVLGETPASESEELLRLVDERPELAAFMREMESVNGLLRDVAATPVLNDDKDWSLDASKRDALLSVIGGELPAEGPAVQNTLNIEANTSKQKRFFQSIAQIAALLCLAVFLGSRWLNSSFVRVGSTAHNEATARFDLGYEAPAEEHEWEMMDGEMMGGAGRGQVEMDGPAASQFSREFESIVGQGVPDMDADGAFMDWDEKTINRSTSPTPYYLQDDVQYAPSIPSPARGKEKAASAGNDSLKRRSIEKPADKRFRRYESDFERELAELSVGAIPLRAGTTQSYAVQPPFESVPPPTDAPATSAPTSNAPVTSESKAVKSPGVRRELGRNQLADSSPPTGHWYSDQGGFGGQAGGVVQVPESNQRLAEKSATPRNRYAKDKQAIDSERFGERTDSNGNASSGQEFYGMDFGGSGFEDFAINGADAGMEMLGGMLGGGADQSEAEPAVEQEIVELKAREEMLSDLFSSETEGLQKLQRELALPSRTPASGGAAPVDENSSLALGDQITEEARIALGARIHADGRSSGRQVEEEYLRQDQSRMDLSFGVQPSFQSPTPGEPAKSNLGKGLARADDRGIVTNMARPTIELRSEIHSDSQRSSAQSSSRSGQIVPALQDTARDSSSLSEFYRPVPQGLQEKSASEEAFSTFSLHVSDVSFQLARAALNGGSWPERAKIRIEEFVNAFDYGDPLPRLPQRVSCVMEQARHPFLQQRNVMRVAMRTAAEGRAASTPLRLTLLLDNSGSMERMDRQQTVRRAFALLAAQLQPSDKVTLIAFARQPRLLADQVSGSEAQRLVQLIQDLPSEGGTNIESALTLALEKAKEQFLSNAQNRIILLTDGAVNLGDADPSSLARMVTKMRGLKLAFDAAGIIADGLNDEVLEALTRRGDGRYYLIDSLEATDEGFARQIAGALRPSAKNVKVQIEFNPKRVGRYKLLGFEKHRLQKEDFRNDQVDAAEMTAAEAGNAVYQFEAKPDGEGDVGWVSVRFRDLSTGQMVENTWPIPYLSDAPRLEQCEPSLRIAASAAFLAAKLQGEALGETVDLKTLSRLAAGLPDSSVEDSRVSQLQRMIQQARDLGGN